MILSGHDSVVSGCGCAALGLLPFLGLSMVGARRSVARRRGPPKRGRGFCRSRCRAFVTSPLLPGTFPSGQEHAMRWRRLYDWHGPFLCGFGRPARNRLRTAFPPGAWRGTGLTPLSFG
jgi:hypothetical protein